MAPLASYFWSRKGVARGKIWRSVIAAGLLFTELALGDPPSSDQSDRVTKSQLAEVTSEPPREPRELADQPGPQAAPYADPAPPGFRGVHMGTTIYTRTGLHLRATFGPSYLHIYQSSEANTEQTSNISNQRGTTISALPVDLELWLGGALIRDLALSLVLRAGRAVGGRLHSALDQEELTGDLSTFFLGTGLIYHLDPAQGWLLGAAAGFERWQASFTPGAPPQLGGSGVGVSLYGGHDFWLAPNLAFGLIARLNMGVTSGDGSAEVGQVRLESADTSLYFQTGLSASLSYF